MTGEVLRDLVVCLPVVVPAVFAGRAINRRLRGASFFRYVHAGLIVTGSLLVAVTLAG